MITVRCHYENGDTTTTSIHATLEQAEEFFVGKVFNIGSFEDNLQTCTKIELI